ncbi:hypothetical protein GGI12_003654, partial [Dipsacomyces acuminosporus]
MSKQANGSPLQLFFEEEEKEEEQKGEDIGSDSALRSDAGDLKEVDKLNNDVQMLTISLSAAEQRNTDLQKQHEEMLARLCAREIEHTGELQMAARRTSQAAPQRIHFLEAQAATKDNAIRRLESHVEDLLATISELICALDAKSEELEAAQRTIDKHQAAQGIESAAAQNPTERLPQSMVDVALVERQHTDIERLASRLSAADERNLNLQEQLEELQARFSVRDFEYTAEVQLTTRLREENAINSELLTQSHRRINNLETQCNARDESIRQLETRVASLQADLQDKSGALDARTKELKALQEDSQRQQTDYAELNLRYADKASKAESLEAQLASTTQAKNQLEDSILAIDSLMVEKEAEIAALKQSIGDLSKTNMSLQTKVFAGEAEAKLIQDQYSSLFINYTTRELDYAAEVTKSQSLAEEANAANSQRVQYERKIAELS